MTLDPAQVDSGSSWGQATLLVIAVTALLTSVTPHLKGLFSRPKGDKRSNYKTLVSELESARRDNTFLLETNRNLGDWQLAGRELIRILRNDIIEAGLELSSRVISLSDRIEQIENKDPYEKLREEKRND